MDGWVFRWVRHAIIAIKRLERMMMTKKTKKSNMKTLSQLE